MQAMHSWEEASVSGKEEAGSSGNGGKVAQRVYQDLDAPAALAAAVASPKMFGGWGLGKLNRRLGLGDQRKVSTAAVLTDKHADICARFELGRVIGRGQFGVIRLLEDRATGERLACKTISKAALKVPGRSPLATRLLLWGVEACMAPACEAILMLLQDTHRQVPLIETPLFSRPPSCCVACSARVIWMTCGGNTVFCACCGGSPTCARSGRPWRMLRCAPTGPEGTQGPWPRHLAVGALGTWLVSPGRVGAGIWLAGP